MRKRPRFNCLLIFFCVLSVPFWFAGGVSASNLIEEQTWLPGDTIFPDIAFTQPMPVFGPGDDATPRVDAQKHNNITVTMGETTQQVLPAPYNPTRVWAYQTTDTKKGTLLGPAHWPAVTLVAKRGSATTVKYVNDLPSFNPLNPTGAGMVQGLLTVDKTIHWADPLDSPAMNYCIDDPLQPGCDIPFIGSPPAVPHLHGAEQLSGFDGGPTQWFTANGTEGPGYYSIGTPGPGEAIYKYINKQEPGTLWFHDHALGATRTNVYTGLAGFYFVKDSGKEPKNLPKDEYEIEMALQDRQFDTDAQFFFPDGSGLCGSGGATDPCLNGPPPNPGVHPFWIPEFIGDVSVVNGAAWPYLAVEPRRYLFRLLDGANARVYRLTFGNIATGETLPPVYQIGSDVNYFDQPVSVSQVFIAPGERAYVIVDFSGVPPGGTVTLMNDAPIPYPNGLVPGVDVNQVGMGRIMQFRVSLPLDGEDKSCNPAVANQCKRPAKLVRLADGVGGIATGVTVDRKRQLALLEADGPGGPLNSFLNNTYWDGSRSANIVTIFPADGVSELPQVGSIEQWEIINLTPDAHPIHVHLTQFQVLNRQAYNADPATGYPAVYNAAFGSAGQAPLPEICTAGSYCPGYGPPLSYNVLNGDGALGGNPAVSSYLTGAIIPPEAGESGWKETVKSYPGQVLRILVRWAPSDKSVKSVKAGKNPYSFDPTQGPGYVWHCHILDHEDNEMMRPYNVTK